jgi:hypothetical protein
VIGEIERLMRDDTAGDPVSGIKWTRKASEKISGQLRRLGIWVSASSVRRLLKQLNFHLHVNKKTICSTRSADRDRQFKLIRRACARFKHQGLPIISVDTKKREMIGLFKNAGAKWAKAATPVNDHDFLKDAVGVAISYGVYDAQANRGHIVVGTSHDTSGFAGDALALWWNREGRGRYPHADRVLILADCGGSNGNRTYAWKCALQEKLCDRFRLKVTLAHYPPGTSKWNPIEHRLFSEISKNWAGQPLVSYETMLKYIRTTKTKRGLAVRATLLKGHYPTRLKPDAERIAALKLRPSRTLPAWNYTIAPARTM